MFCFYGACGTGKRETGRMRLIALLTAIGLLKAANGLAWAGHVVGDAGIWIIDQCEMRRRL